MQEWKFYFYPQRFRVSIQCEGNSLQIIFPFLNISKQLFLPSFNRYSLYCVGFDLNELTRWWEKAWKRNISNRSLTKACRSSNILQFMPWRSRKHMYFVFFSPLIGNLPRGLWNFSSSRSSVRTLNFHEKFFSCTKFENSNHLKLSFPSEIHVFSMRI